MKTFFLFKNPLFGQQLRYLALLSILGGFVTTFSACEEVFISDCDRIDDDSNISQDYALAPFSQMKLHIDADVYLTQGPNQQVRIEGPTSIVNAVNLGVQGQTWNIDLERCFRGDYNLKIYVTTPDIQSIEVLSSGVVESWEPIISDRLNLRVSGSGSIRLQVQDTPEVFSVISGSGKIALEGDATHHDIHLTGSGDLSGYQFYTDTADVNLSGSGNAYIFVQDMLDAGISGSGSIYYKGFPDISASISGSGSVVESN